MRDYGRRNRSNKLPGNPSSSEEDEEEQYGGGNQYEVGEITDSPVKWCSERSGRQHRGGSGGSNNNAPRKKRFIIRPDGW